MSFTLMIIGMGYMCVDLGNIMPKSKGIVIGYLSAGLALIAASVIIQVVGGVSNG